MNLSTSVDADRGNETPEEENIQGTLKKCLFLHMIYTCTCLVNKNLLVLFIDSVCLSSEFLKLGVFYCVSEPSSPSPVKPVKRYILSFITIILDFQDEDLNKKNQILILSYFTCCLNVLRLWLHTG